MKHYKIAKLILLTTLLQAALVVAQDDKKIDSEIDSLVKAEQKIVSGDKEQVEMIELKNKLSSLESENKKLVSDFKRAIQGLKAIKAAKAKIAKENSQYQKDQEKLKEERGQLQQEIVHLQNDLLLRETEIKVLSGDPSAKRELDKMRVEGKTSLKSAVPVEKKEEIASDITIVEVIADKVNIRSGAGIEHSPIMQVQRGTRLTVEAREGAWYRVFTPTGSRGYIQMNVVRQAQAKMPAKKIVNVDEGAEGMVPFDDANGAKDSSLERRALDRLRSNFRDGGSQQ